MHALTISLLFLLGFTLMGVQAETSHEKLVKADAELKRMLIRAVKDKSFEGVGCGICTAVFETIKEVVPPTAKLTKEGLKLTIETALSSVPFAALFADAILEITLDVIFKLIVEAKNSVDPPQICAVIQLC